MTDISYRLTITPPLSREEEQTCLCRAQYYNDENALERLVTSNYAYMVGRTKQIFATSNSEHSDALLSSAVFGMLIAINKFDLQLIPDVRLRSYATHWIDRYIRFGIIELTWSRYPRLPSNVRRLFETYKTLRKRHEHTTGRVAHHREILVDTDLQKYEDVFHLYVDPIALSLDTPTAHDDDDDGYLHERIAGDIPDVDGMLRSIDSESALSTIKQKLADMPAQMREILEQSYGITCPEKTLTEIARNNNMSRERARQLRERGLRSLKRNGIELSTR